MLPFAEEFASLGLDSADGFLDLPGEVVSGHPDRHVVRVVLPGSSSAYYLKRQHAVSRREKWRNWRAGFGWVSRSEREAVTLGQLSGQYLPCPRWAAVGADGRGRAFLLIEELAGAVDLRKTLGDAGLSPTGRIKLARNLGRLIARYHSAGFTTPDLSAKHVLVSPGSEPVTLIDWQSSVQGSDVPLQNRLRALATLHASLVEALASPRERLRVMWAALKQFRGSDPELPRFRDLVQQVLAEAHKLSKRRSIRDQRQSAPQAAQRLVWVDGEAVCAVPEIAAIWPTPAITAPYYGGEPGTFPLGLPNGRDAVVTRGSSFAPLERLKAWVKGRPWRSPGAALGRLLFHLERYEIPAPKLLAFGQRITGPATADWFALHTRPSDPIPHYPDVVLAELLGRLLRQLHDAGCSAGAKPLTVFGRGEDGISVREVTRIRIGDADTSLELRTLLAALSPSVRKAARAGYESGERVPVQTKERFDMDYNRITTADVLQ
jgi:tRNA A-37 threonylcarbamoyl transferase component Bud32